jgi:hypothetical protein
VAGALSNSSATAGQRNILYIGPALGTSNLTPNNTMSSDTAAWVSAVGPLTWFKATANANRSYATADNVQLLNPFNLTSPSFVPRTASPIVSAAPASFTDSKLTDSFFTPTTYIGAFDPSGTSASNWLAGWTNFDPQNTDY